MPCTRPLTGYRPSFVNPLTGKGKLVFNQRQAHADFGGITLPCGQCRHCRLEYSRQWAIRAVHEAQVWDQNCFLTLTYAPEHLPPGGHLDYEAPVLFMKRLRERFGSDIRSFGCGEYGENGSRPHYHLCIFNFDFSDKEFRRKTSQGHDCWTSKSLSELWPFGFSEIGSLTFESAAYVARYVTKKFTNRDEALVEAHYGGRPPERALCVSRRPGLGRPWFDLYGSRLWTHDYIVLRGRKMRAPKYYDSLLCKQDAVRFAAVKKARKCAGKEAACVLEHEDRLAFKRFHEKGSYTPFKNRLTVLEEVQELSFKLLKRGFEYG